MEILRGIKIAWKRLSMMTIYDNTYGKAVTTYDEHHKNTHVAI